MLDLGLKVVNICYMDKKSEDPKIFSIRLPMWLYNYLLAESKEQERSLNKQIMLHLKEAIDLEEAMKSMESPREEGRATDTKESGGDAASNMSG